jgi:acetyl esterase
MSERTNRLPTLRKLEPSTAALIEERALHSLTPIYQLSVEDARGVLSYLHGGKVEKLRVEIHDRVIRDADGRKISIRILRPQDGMSILPVVMYFHGGGWNFGDKDTHDRLVREIANGANAAVVFVNYTPSPEARYPVAIEEAYAATEWVAENSQALKIDPARIAVAGDGVGGNMAAAVTLMAKERGGPKVIFQLLFYPVTDANFETDSYNEFADGPWLTREAMRRFWNNYAPDVALREEPTASPLKATNEQLAGLPPGLVITAENSVLRDEGEAYARNLMRAGVSVTAARYLGTIHDFVMLNAITESPATRAAIAQANDALRKAFIKRLKLPLDAIPQTT